MAVRMDALVSAIAREAGLDPDRDSQAKTNIIAWVNDTRREISELPVRFNSLEFVGEFVGTQNVTAGTVNATQNQAEVTGSSTAWTTAMGGRYIAIGSSPWQRISYVTDTTHLTLESSWLGDTVTSKSYKIWKRDYPVPPKASKITRIIDLSDQDREIAFEDNREFHGNHGFGDSFSDPVAFTQFGQDDIGYNYLTSTVYTSVSVTANSPIVDFAAGAGIVTGLYPGDQITLGNTTTSTAFYIDRILTDTKAVLHRKSETTSTSLSATGLSQDRLLLRFYPGISNTKVYLFEGRKKLENITSSADYVEEGWYNAVRKGAIAKAMGYVNSPKEPQKLKEYDIEVDKLVRNQFKVANPAIRLKVNMPRRYLNVTRLSDRDD